MFELASYMEESSISGRGRELIEYVYVCLG